MSMQTDPTPDWPQQATETIVNLVDNVKHKTTEPATKAVRGLVYGIVIVLLGVPAVIIAFGWHRPLAQSDQHRCAGSGRVARLPRPRRDLHSCRLFMWRKRVA